MAQNPAERSGGFADAPDVSGRDTMLKERTETRTDGDQEGER